MSDERTPSKSPSRSPSVAPLTRTLSGLGARWFGGAKGGDASSLLTATDSDTLAEVDDQGSIDERKRSVSRGREAFKSSGRGGAGNIKASPSIGHDIEDSLSPSRGRELPIGDKTRSVGRGGVGNIRSQSRARAASQVSEGHPHTQSILSENSANTAAFERAVIEDAGTKASAIRSSGRGGAGNISRSRSRTPGKFFGSTPDSPRHSTGRGGAGNITGGPDGDAVDEAGLYRAQHEHDGIHSTGRGGRANLTDVHSPPPEALPHQQAGFEAIGRGGAGNIVRSRSHSRDPERRSVSRDRIAKVWQKITHHGSADGDIAEEGASADEGARAGVGE
ncbi:hypothetical protein PHLGIDRAFT_11763 [Phlebiopsis gigantea 11061_1 CR5-6]|uniref:Uncharacterized protein n=1 Tax=Phlebiopsis gigantea (strain 11061_1 CR5-6) TaxID=745531 RepID=A0A0C3PRG5_PHLG1|nr:hypothetical protein PHLGIDRAFT_11763 [Phlebiopsis gigantea 11061_1 CR5-6]